MAAAASAAKTVVVKEGHVSKIASRFSQQFETNSGDILWTSRKPEPLSLMTKPNRIPIDVDNAASASVRPQNFALDDINLN